MGELEWLNKYGTEGTRYQTTTEGVAEGSDLARVQSWGDVLGAYRVHPEPKSLAPDGKPAGWHGIGLLARRPVAASRLVHVGKESNELEEIQAGTIHAADEVLNEYVREDVWREFVLPLLGSMSRSQLRDAGLSGTSISQVKGLSTPCQAGAPSD